jgi:serine-type D-Ala-D-Ala carboxypeptidase/endopeptidase (penicillin-binding protein 4)
MFFVTIAQTFANARLAQQQDTMHQAGEWRAWSRILIKLASASISLSVYAITCAHGAPLPAPLRDALAQTGVPPEGAALYVKEVGAARPLVEHNIDRAMNPASTLKLITTLAGLEVLGPSFVWRTEAWLDGPLNGDSLEGNLVLKGYGDPKLTLEDFWLFLRDLRVRGMREIRGDLVIDRSLFALEEIDPGRFDNDPTRPYNVGPDALLVNYKAIRLQFLPVEQTGAVRIISTPELPQISIVNQLTLGPAPCDTWPEKPIVDLAQSRLTFTGVFPYGCGEKQRNFSLLNRNQYLAALFGQLWRDLGGSFRGAVRDGTVPERARWLTTWESPPLADVIRDINKFSNNVMARQLYLTLSLAAANPPATTDNAMRAVRAWLQRNQLDFPELQMDNGSGLSRSTRITARHLAELLAYAWRSPYMPEYVSSLPVPGVDGTLRRRLGDSFAAGHAHIKTGYLDSVRAIAGYLTDGHGRTFIVVSLINDAHAVNAQSFQDAVIEWTYGQATQPR